MRGMNPHRALRYLKVSTEDTAKWFFAGYLDIRNKYV